jgi:GNAT superfamily N-acetyltransferase
VPDWRAEVDHWWAGVLRVPVAAVRAGGVFALGHVDHAGVVAVEGAAAPIVYGPARVLPALHAAVRAGSGDLGTTTHLALALGPLASRVLGPAWYGYVTAQTLGPPPSQAVRPLREPDLPLLAVLRERTSPAEREESGTTGLPAFGYFDEGELRAVACLGMWHGMPTIGVLTDPGARGRGLAGMVVTAAARAGLSRRPVVQYRAWRRNTASIAVAVRCGFTHHCDGLVIHLVR